MHKFECPKQHRNYRANLQLLSIENISFNIQCILDRALTMPGWDFMYYICREWTFNERRTSCPL